MCKYPYDFAVENDINLGLKVDYVRESYKSYSGTSPNSLSYWVEMVL